MADLDDEIAAAEKRVQEGRNALANLRAGDRSYIAKIIVWSFVLLMALLVLATIIGTIFLDWTKLMEPAKFLMAILSSVMLPVVTLVIGYYFGSEK
jgi:hypothetical protein